MMGSITEGARTLALNGGGARTLALNGGVPVRSEPPPLWPYYAEDEIAAVVATLRSGKVNQWTGCQVSDFEKACSEKFGQPYALAVANGTLALEAVLRAHEIGPGDEVIVTPRSFIASASCVNLVDGTPVFADIDRNTGLITPETVRPHIGNRTRAIIVVHLNGRPADMPGLMSLAREHNLLVFEDCAQAHGARIKGKSVGSFGHASAFSFCQDKIISTGGEGGLALFSEESIWRKAWSYKDHGKDLHAASQPAESPGFRWLHSGLGSNWRLTEMQAAIGLCHLRKLSEWKARRTAIAEQLAASLAKYPSVRITPLSHGYEHAYYRLDFQVAPERLRSGWDRDCILRALAAEGIPCFSGACPEIYREAAYARPGVRFERLPNAAYLGTVSLALLVHPSLDDRFLADCRCAVRKVFDAATN